MNEKDERAKKGQCGACGEIRVIVHKSPHGRFCEDCCGGTRPNYPRSYLMDAMKLDTDAAIALLREGMESTGTGTLHYQNMRKAIEILKKEKGDEAMIATNNTTSPKKYEPHLSELKTDEGQVERVRELILEADSMDELGEDFERNGVTKPLYFLQTFARASSPAAAEGAEKQ